MDWKAGLTLQKDPDAVLDYQFDWSEWLATGDAIDSVLFIVDQGITADSDSNTATTATVWLSGGTVGAEYSVTCRITTTLPDRRIEDRTITIYIDHM